MLDKMERIVFTGDPFRVTVGFPGQIDNVTWLHNLLASTIGRFTDPEISIIYPLSGGYLGVFADCGLPSELKGRLHCFGRNHRAGLLMRFRGNFLEL